MMKLGSSMEVQKIQAEFIQSLWPFLILSRILGLLPLSGNRLSPHFSWSSLVTWYSFFVTANKALFLVSFVVRVSTTKTSFLGTEGLLITLLILLFYVHNLITAIILLRKVTAFSKLLLSRANAQVRLGGTFRSERKVLCWTIMSVYLLVGTFNYTSHYVAVGMYSNATGSAEAFFRNIGSSRVPMGISGRAWEYLAGVYLLVIGFPCYLGWAFPEVLLLSSAEVLRKRYACLNRKLELLRGFQPSLPTMEAIRFQHSAITLIVKDLDKVLSPLTLNSYLTNILYLFGELYLGLFSHLQGKNTFISFTSLWTVAFVAIRLILPSISAAQMNQEAHKVKRYIDGWSVTSPHRRLEENIRREMMVTSFIYQVDADDIAFSGCGFFVITKSFIMGLVSAIITYQTVIFQFRSSSILSD